MRFMDVGRNFHDERNYFGKTDKNIRINVGKTDKISPKCVVKTDRPEYIREE